MWKQYKILFIISILILSLITSGCIFDEEEKNKISVHFKIKNNSDNHTFSNISIILDSKEVFNKTLSFYEEGWRELDLHINPGTHFVEAFEKDTNTSYTEKFDIKKEISIVITYVNGTYGKHPQFYFDIYDGNKILY